ncbi:LSAMP protein, partial [Polypterus senegalus]|nr:LSAMP protein [Polypterus senegalus]
LSLTAEELDGDEYLEISGITREQAGRYECKASSDGLAPDVKYVNVVVNYPPQIMESVNAEIEVGRTGVLQCDALAVPKPDFEWYRDDKRLYSTQGIHIQNYGTHSVLTVANVTEDHYGNYTCVATNKLGINNASLFLFTDMNITVVPRIQETNLKEHPVTKPLHFITQGRMADIGEQAHQMPGTQISKYPVPKLFTIELPREEPSITPQRIPTFLMPCAMTLGGTTPCLLYQVCMETVYSTGMDDDKISSNNCKQDYV